MPKTSLERLTALVRTWRATAPESEYTQLMVELLERRLCDLTEADLATLKTWREDMINEYGMVPVASLVTVLDKLLLRKAV